jgi:hypothetical protein
MISGTVSLLEAVEKLTLLLKLRSNYNVRQGKQNPESVIRYEIVRRGGLRLSGQLEPAFVTCP